ncbi:MAG: FAD-dependent oxidoreductase [bacterium]|nr:FAD-dependent oxidoreductase [bacterium]MCP5067702.1 FAD-dependent oxidoreductase [bacterium]
MTTIQEPARETEVLTRCDVLVVGGGSAGSAAAIAAAREGARVVLAERYGSLGGLATGGLIALLLTLDDGLGRPVIGGLCEEVTRRMREKGGAFHPPAEEWGDEDPEKIDTYRKWGLVWGGANARHRVRYSVAYDPEVMRLVLNEMVTDAGVDLIYHLWGADALIEDGRLAGVAFQSKAGRQAILADVVIDATGDGDVFASAGCAFAHETVHPWLWFRVGGVLELERVLAEGAPFFRTPNAGQVLFPWGSVASLGRKIDATDPRDLTFAEIECRKLVMQEFEKLKSSRPELADAHICNIATQLGITESRRLEGRYVLDIGDRGKPFEDSIAITGHWTKYGAVYAIPYRSLQAREFPNLLAAGRNISVDHRTHNATKEIPPSMTTGQAAGTAAALAVSTGEDLASIDVAKLRERLRQAGGIVDYPFESAPC